MNLTDAIVEQDLLLARLASSKLAGLLHGTLSVGVASLELEAPADFLAGKEKLPLGILEVLRGLGVKPGQSLAIEPLRQQVDHLTQLTVRFHRLFLELAQWRSLSPVETRQTAGRLSDTYSHFYESLETLCSLLGMNADYSAKVQDGRARLDDFLETCTMAQSQAPGRR